ncbi:MAG: hypothetical protein A2Z06_03675 [Candidatus Glassbacteria bacterium RBG_16_58_8]|uniref:Uncharacterized protein n=1 Tax=Candidatus Glassbacteria bacterium RBG_16_58_8 TaxID=1817866 RepID=A0A1F5YCN7_9BACT|nr:MAG: hypothetical protein A2Z06_03675 [Candidatus Glassbacteria bacterium RBG_16_58_8]
MVRKTRLQSLSAVAPILGIILMTIAPEGLGQVEGFRTESAQGEGDDHAFANLLPNGDFEMDDDVDGFPNDWSSWPWTVEDRLDLRKAIFEYLDTSAEAVLRPKLTTRFSFYGKKSLDIVSIDGKTGPGVFTTRDFSPGIYTISLYAKNPGEGVRSLGISLAGGGRLFEVGHRWRNVVHTERIPFHLKAGEVSLRDWTYAPGELLVDRVVLLKLPFDVAYPDRFDFREVQNRLVIDFSGIGEAPIPIGINLEIRTPSGEIVRKNMEGTLDPPSDQAIFEFHPSEEGRYSLKVEIYDLRTADVIYSDDRIEAIFRAADIPVQGDIVPERVPLLDFFPVGIRIRSHELGDLRGMGFNSVLITEPDVESILAHRDQLERPGSTWFLEIVPDRGEVCGERLRELVRSVQEMEGFSGWFLWENGQSGGSLSEGLRETLRCIREAGSGHSVILENVLPADGCPGDSVLVDFMALDPDPVSEPSRPLYMYGLWADRLGAGSQRKIRTIAMPQIFGGWPIARRCPLFTEVRAMAYLSIIHGAEGIFYRDFSSQRPFFDQPDAAWDVRKVPELWGKIPGLNS